MSKSSKEKAGFYFFPEGEMNEIAWNAALSFIGDNKNIDEVLDNYTPLFCYGRNFSPRALKKLSAEIFSKDNSVLFGARILDWQNFVRGLARNTSLKRGFGFKELNISSQREYFHAVLEALEKAELIPSIQGLWQEEKFFNQLLHEIEELRLAGFCQEWEIERLRDLLKDTPKVAVDDLVTILFAYEKALGAENIRKHDKASLLHLAKEAESYPRELFVFGMEQLSLLEIELLQNIAKNIPVFFPVNASEEEIIAVLAEKTHVSPNTSALQNLRLLNTNYIGNKSLWDDFKKYKNIFTKQTEQKKIPCFIAHTPVEEIRSAALFIRSVSSLYEKKKWRILVPKNYFSRPMHWQAFQHALGFDEIGEKNLSRAISESRAARLLLSSLELKIKDFPLDPVLDFCILLNLGKAQNSYLSIPALAAKLGIRGGIKDWKIKAEQSNNLLIKKFVQDLEKLADFFPSIGTAQIFHKKFQEFCKEMNIAVLAKQTSNDTVEQEMHLVLAAILRNSALLASSIEKKISYKSWFTELKILLQQNSFEFLGGELADIDIYTFTSKMPPLKNDTNIIVLGLQNGVEPKQMFSCFLQEKQRRGLQNWQLSSRSLQEEDFIHYFQKISSVARLNENRLFFSYSLYDETGKELSPSWILDLFLTEKDFWPPTSFAFTKKNKVREIRDFFWNNVSVSSFSPTLLESYKSCAFRALVSRLWKIEDGALGPEIDIPKMEEGFLLHKSLEYYFTTFNGRWLKEKEKRIKSMEESLLMAVKEHRLEYYKGSNDLLSVQLKHLQKKLEKFIEAETIYFEQFPQWDNPLCEIPFEGIFGGKFPFKGKIDRIDIDPVGKKVAVVDYKSGASTPTSKDIKEMKNFQIPFYLKAAENFTKFNPIGAYFLSLHTLKRNNGMFLKDTNKEYFGLNSRNASLMDEEEFQSIQNGAESEAIALAEKIELGEFPISPMEPETCERCDVRPVCRIREQNKKKYNDEEKSGSITAFSKLWEEKIIDIANEKNDIKPALTVEQEKAILNEGQLTFVEASAGTGKTTVLVEKILFFLENRIKKEKVAFHDALEKVLAISFTEKSAAELAHRFSKKIFEKHGAALAAQANHSVSTIHGFCRKIIRDFPLEAGVDPLAEVLDVCMANDLLNEVLEDFFLFPDKDTKENLFRIFEKYTRSALAKIFSEFMERRSILEKDINILRGYCCGENKLPSEYIFEESQLDFYNDFLLLFSKLCERYDEAKKKRIALDYNDLERLAWRALQHDKVQRFYREKYELILVDEFQDTNSIQRDIVSMLAKPEWGNVFVVGDAKQSIYRFRAADVSVFQTLRKEAEKKNSLFPLTKNYRSFEPIVKFSNIISAEMFPSVNAESPEFEAQFRESQAGKGIGKLTNILHYSLEAQEEKRITAQAIREWEAKQIALLIKKLIKNGRAIEEIALLFRKISGNDVYFEELKKAGISFVLGSSDGFYEEQVVLDGISLLRALVEENNYLALMAVLRSPWFFCSDTELAELFSQNKKDPWNLLDRSKYKVLFSWKKKVQEKNLNEILTEAYQQHPAFALQRDRVQMDKLVAIVDQFINKGMGAYELTQKLTASAGWINASEAIREASVAEPGANGAMQILSIHAAKGLEFPVTILADLDAAIPADRSKLRFYPGIGTAAKQEEENNNVSFDALGEANELREAAESKRLFYVALTRAKEEQYLFLRKKEKLNSKKEKFTWGDWIRHSWPKLDGHYELLQTEENDENFIVKSKTNEFSEIDIQTAKKIELPQKTYFIKETSVTELASHVFCEEFHRRKFVQNWDDTIIALWEKPKNFFQNHQKDKDNQETLQLKELLKAAGIEKKERGIALHRILERIDSTEEKKDIWRIWLEEAYSAQGVSMEKEAGKKLLNLDLELISNFLKSEIGKQLFSPEVKAYAELPFLWEEADVVIHGTVDRIVSISDREWILADYKSSSLEKSEKRYAFQINSYVGALYTYLRSRGIQNPKISSYLINLYEAGISELPVDFLAAKNLVRGEISKIQENYSLRQHVLFTEEKKITGTENCFLCPYSLHCGAGKKIVLRSE